MRTKLTPGQRVVRDLARQIEAKTTRLRNKARLVAGDPNPGRNLTALRTTAAEMSDLLDQVLEQRCRACGCTEGDCSGCVGRTGGPCLWEGPDLCSACAGEEARR